MSVVSLGVGLERGGEVEGTWGGGGRIGILCFNSGVAHDRFLCIVFLSEDVAWSENACSAAV